MFLRVKERVNPPPRPPEPPPFRHDVFMSYSHANKEPVDELLRRLRAGRLSLRVFLDTLSLHPGVAWQHHIFEALDSSRKIVCMLSPQYLASKVCKEEFNIALLRHRESGGKVLLPVYLYIAELPTYIKLIQYVDAREADSGKIAQAADVLPGQLCASAPYRAGAGR